MPSRDASKKKNTVDRSVRASSVANRGLADEQLIADLEARLEAANARIAELERARDQVLDRIAWVVDSLHNVLEK